MVIQLLTLASILGLYVAMWCVFRRLSGIGSCDHQPHKLGKRRASNKPIILDPDEQKGDIMEKMTEMLDANER